MSGLPNHFLAYFACVNIICVLVKICLNLGGEIVRGRYVDLHLLVKEIRDALPCGAGKRDAGTGWGARDCVNRNDS